MVATTAGASLEDSCVASEQDDAAWLVRQFGRFSPLLREACTRAGGGVPCASDFGFLIGSKVIATQEHVQSRRLLQLSNKQHQEHLQNLQQLSAAHAQRLHTRSRGQRRKRARGCEHNAESSSSSSSEDEAAEGTNAPGKPGADRDAAGRSKEQGGGAPPQALSEGPPLSAPTEEAAALLLSAYDLITCTTGSSSGAPASLPASLLTFLNSQEQRARTSSARSHKKSEGSEAAKPSAAPKTGGALRSASSSTNWFEGNEDESRSEQENVDPYYRQFSDLDAAEAHPIQQLQENVMNLPCPNQSAKERLMREQLRLLAVRWKCLLLSGWNILVAGCGSKGRLLREFASLALNDGFCCVMNAHQREFKLHQALQAIVQVIRNYLVSHSKSTAAASALIKTTQTAGGASASCMRLVKELKALMTHVPHLLYLVVLGLDSSALMDARRHLATLASCDKVRLICSADHIQHALLVDAAELRDFRFVFETAHTRQDYREEVLSRWGSMCGFVPGWLWSGSRMQAGAIGGSSVNFSVVLRGLTTNHKRLLRSIAELQLNQLERNESPIVSLADLGTETSGVSLSLSKLKLKELLIEVTSHGAAFHAKKNGQDAVAIRANKAQLQELLELLEKAGV